MNMKQETAEKIFWKIRAAADEIDKIVDIIKSEIPKENQSEYIVKCGNLISDIDDLLWRPILREFPGIEKKLLPHIYEDDD